MATGRWRTMTKMQQESVALIYAHGGYACLHFGCQPRWTCARYVEGEGYVGDGPVLPTNSMTRLKNAGGLVPALGHGYGSCSFWKPAAAPEDFTYQVPDEK